MAIINEYFNTVLEPYLKKSGIDVKSMEAIEQDVSRRLRGIITKWNDIEFRKPLLFLAIEEAEFYGPPSSDVQIACLVNLAIRNSELETFHSAGYLSQADMRKITQRSILYFRAANFDDCEGIRDEDNPYTHLPSSYPAAWAAILQLSQVDDEIAYAPVRAKSYSYSVSPVPIQLTSAGEVLENGVVPWFNQRLITEIEQAKTNHKFIYSDSLKMRTRNTEKTLKIIEILLHTKCSLVTANLYISNGYVSRRAKFVQPASDKRGFDRNRENLLGISSRHRDCIRFVNQNLPSGLVA